eukprot:15440797-Alexandrium_andersonii.AAC.1
MGFARLVVPVELMALPAPVVSIAMVSLVALLVLMALLVLTALTALLALAAIGDDCVDGAGGMEGSRCSFRTSSPGPP